MRPHVRAFRAHDERYVSHELDADLAHLRVRLLPLLIEEPLYVSNLNEPLTMIGTHFL